MVPESESTGVTFPYERQAMNGGEMPDGLSYPDQIFYLCLRMLYDQYRKGIVDRDTAVIEKKKLLDQYRTHKFLEEVQESTVQLWKAIEIAASEYRKAPSIEAADKLLKAIYGVDRKPMEAAEV